MDTLKDKVTQRLSRLFADSPSSPSSIDLDRQQNQAKPYYNGGKSESFTSLLSFVLPSATSDGFSSNKDQYDLKPISPLPVLRSDEGAQSQYEFDSYDFYTPLYENSDKPTLQEDKDCSQTPHGRSNRDSSEVFKEAPEGRCEGRSLEKPQYQERPMANLTDDSTFISPELYEFLYSSIPNIVKGCQWVLLYSTLRHGISLRTLIRKSADLPGPCLLIVGDKKGVVFGGLLQGPLNPTSKRKYQGTSQTFVFTTIYGAPRLFRPTGTNRYFYMCLNDLLAFGGGGSFALSLDEDLLNGTSGPCDTFGNLCLAHNPEFELKNVELWGFTHSSRYLK